MNATTPWSGQQEIIFDRFKTGKGNVVVRARAGTGKTTTIIEGVSRAPERKILLAAFNKRIQEELSRKIRSSNVEAKTLHGVGFSYVMMNWKGCRVDNDRGQRLVEVVLKRDGCDDVPREISRLIARLASRAKSTCPFPTLERLIEEAKDADIMPEDELEDAYPVKFIAEKAMKAMDLACEQDGTIDFDDMVFVPLRKKWVFGRWELVVIDEAQDMSYSQLLLAQRACKKNGRIFVVGDDCQAIYGFRGADHRSIDRLKKELKAEELGLTITYRCPQKVVSLARELVSDYQAAPSAPEGEVTRTTRDGLVKEAQPGCFVLSRKNAPLAKVCLTFLRANKRAFIEGRDIGKSLIALVQKIKGKSVPDFIARLGKWKERELARAEKLDSEAKREAKAELVTDQHETLLNLVEGLKSVGELVTRIDTLFSDVAEGDRGMTSIVCSSTHRAKGLERDTVYLLEETFTKRNVEERNITYVAITRAKKKLTWVSEPGGTPLFVSPKTTAAINEMGNHLADVGFKHHGHAFVEDELNKANPLGFDPSLLK